MQKTAVVIQAGGTGTRLWPLSRGNSPKQFKAIFNDQSLVRNTYDRLVQRYVNKDIFISTNISFTNFVKEQIPEIEDSNYILEPKKMDKTAAFGLINLILKDKGYDTVVLIACDDYIGNVHEFLHILNSAEEAIATHKDKVLLVGINPNHPATGYGYIEMGDSIGEYNKETVFKVQSFKEKPDLKTAEEYIADWRYLWNAGWFVFNCDFMIEKYKELVPDTHKHLENCYKLDPKSPEFLEEFSKCEEISFDVSVVEKLKDILVIPANIGWSDVGSWKLIKDILTERKEEENCFKGNVINVNSKGSFVYSTDSKKVIGVIGLENIAIIDTGDALLVTTLDKSQEVKKIVDQLPEEYK
jgi:mannose-1-phosphate guanylyltransferase